MRERFGALVTDLSRFGPVASVTLATLVCLPSLGEFLDRHLTATSMLGRYLVALAISTIGVRLVTGVFVAYAKHNFAEAEREAIEARLAARAEHP